MSVEPGLPLGVDDADAAEQLRELRPSEGEPLPSIPLDADEYDAAEQSIVVESDDDEDYR
jgi:hypothetical protein